MVPPLKYQIIQQLTPNLGILKSTAGYTPVSLPNPFSHYTPIVASHRLVIASLLEILHINSYSHM